MTPPSKAPQGTTHRDPSAASPDLPRRTGHPTGERRDLRATAPRLLGALTYLAGLLDLAGGLVQVWRPRLHPVLAVVPGLVTVADLAVAASLLTGVLLLALGHALRRRKRRAWRAVVALLAVSFVAALLRHQYVHAAVPAVLLVVLVVRRDDFRALGDPTTRWRAVRVLVLLLLADIVLGLGLVYIASRDIFGGAPALFDALGEVGAGLLGLDGPLTFVHERMADLVGTALAGLGLLTAAVPTYVALRSPVRRAELTPDDVARMRPLLAQGGDSLGYFALRDDKSVIWAPSGRAAVAYRVVGGVMLASGDPLGRNDFWPEAIDAFLDEAAAHAWTPAVLGCSESAGAVWAKAGGMAALELGDEAVLDVEDFSLEGRPMRNVRQMVGRIRRAGYEAQVSRVGDLEDAVRAVVLADADRWRGSETERGFSMALGRVASPLDPDAVLVTAWEGGRVRALLQFVPWGPDGLSLDLMRRDVDAAAGANELLIATVMEAAPGLGVRRVSLNFAAFRAVFERGERLGAGPLLRARRGMLIMASRWFQIDSLHRFNAKFRPEWSSRFLVYPSAADLPRVSLAALEAEAFLQRPSFRRLTGGRG